MMQSVRIDQPHSRTLAAIFLGALSVRSFNFLLLSDDLGNFFTEDSSLYWPSAGYAAVTDSERVPLYLLLLAGIRLIFGDAPLVAIFMQGLIDSGTCVLIALLGSMISTRVGWIAGALAAIWPNLIVHSAFLLSDSLFLFLFTSMLFVSAGYLRDATPRGAGYAGLLCGLSTMTRTVTQFLPFAMAPAALLIALVQRKGVRTGIIAMALFAAGTAIPVAPWLARNVLLFGAWTLTAQQGSHLTNWVLPLIRQARDGTPHETAAREIEGQFIERLRAQGIEPQTLPALERSRAFTELALDALAAEPASAIAKAWIKGAVVNLAAPAIAVDPRIRRDRAGSFYNDPSPGLIGRLRGYLSTFSAPVRSWLIAALVMSAASLMLQAYGFLRLATRLPWAAVFAALIVLYFLLVTGPIVSPKYRLPIEPILIVFTALGLEGLWRHMEKARGQASPS